MSDVLASEGAHTSEDIFEFQEVQLAFRNRGIPAEGLGMPITPTGMHYLLNHWDIPVVDASTWQLDIGGHVNTPIKLNLDDLKKRPVVEMPVTLECAGNGRAFMKPRPINQPWTHDAVSTAVWTGTPLKGILEEAGLVDGALEVLFTGADRGIQAGEDQYYQRSLSIANAMNDEVILAYEMNGAPLEPQHGYPLRLLVPGWYGMTSVKWLDRIEVVTEPFNGMQMMFYRETSGAGDAGTAIETIKVRALMVPPGVSTFPSLERRLEPGPVTLKGRAWAGKNQISRVEVSTDDGETWNDATLEDPIGEFAWRGWNYEWQATPGKHTLASRATDSKGNIQPLEQVVTFYGVGNNGVARVEVNVK